VTRALMIVSFLFFSAATASAQTDVLTPGPTLRKTDKQTVSGAYWRAMEHTDSVPYVAPYRQFQFEQPNFGLRARVNATDSAARAAEFPSMPPPPPMANY
jgi:hypothetical protein